MSGVPRIQFNQDDEEESLFGIIEKTVAQMI